MGSCPDLLLRGTGALRLASLQHCEPTSVAAGSRPGAMRLDTGIHWLFKGPRREGAGRTMEPCVGSRGLSRLHAQTCILGRAKGWEFGGPRELGAWPVPGAS